MTATHEERLRLHRHPVYGLVLLTCIIAFAAFVLRLRCNWERIPYNLAQQASAAGDAPAAAALLARQVRVDQKVFTLRALKELLRMQDISALDEMIDLMDVPEGRWMGSEERLQLWEQVQSRVAATGIDLPYHPRASEAVRAEQEAAWRQWFDTAVVTYEWVDGRFAHRRPPQPATPGKESTTRSSASQPAT